MTRRNNKKYINKKEKELQKKNFFFCSSNGVLGLGIKMVCFLVW